MKIFRLGIIFLMVTVTTFAIKLDDVTFDREILKGESVEKSFIIENNGENKLRYVLEIENGEENKNIEVFPKTFLISPNKKGKFTVRIKGEEVGEKSYFLTIEEQVIDFTENKSQLRINMKYRVEQNYIVK